MKMAVLLQSCIYNNALTMIKLIVYGHIIGPIIKIK